MENKNIITLVRGDDSTFLNQVFLVISFKTNLNLEHYKARLTIENPVNLIQMYEVINNAVSIDLDKVFSSTLEVGLHRCNIKLIDTLNRVKTVYNFDINIEDEFDTNYQYPNEYELEIVLDDGINKYKNYEELSNKPSINNVKLSGNKTFEQIGITQLVEAITTDKIEEHNTKDDTHEDIRNTLDRKQDRLIAGSNITIIDGIISALGDNGGVTTDYEELGNKPKINDIVLSGNKTLDELGIQPKGEYISEEILNNKGFLTEVPSGYITEDELAEKNYLQEIPETYFTDEQNAEKYFTIENAETKQDKLTAGENIIISEENIISANIPENYITEEKLSEYDYTTDEKLNTLLDNKQNRLLAGDNIKLYRNVDGTYTISALDSKSQVTINSYNSLSNLPTINNITLLGNKTLDELGIQPKGKYQNKLTAGENIIIEDQENNTVIKATIPDDICTDIELNAGLLTKADKATTLLGYGIQDAYTKEETKKLFTDNISKNLTDVFFEAPNGVSTYTENNIYLQENTSILFANGRLNNILANKLYKITENKTFDVSQIDYSSDLNKFLFVAILDENIEELVLTIIPATDFYVTEQVNIPLDKARFVQHIKSNKYYEIINKKAKKVLFKIIGQGEILNNNGKCKIYNYYSYNSYSLVTRDEISQELNQLQEKLTFGDNFVVENNIINYSIPSDYITKQYLIDYDYTTQVNLNDAINIHNTNTNTHQDIRNDIKNNYATKNQLQSVLDKLNRIIELNDLQQ